MNALVRGLLLLAVGTGVPASAQVGLPPLPTEGLPLPRELPLPSPVPRAIGETAEPLLSSVRQRARELLQRYPGQVERDPRGAPAVRAVIIALAPDEQALQQALTRGYVIQSDETLAPLDERVVTLLVPPGVSTRRALRDLRAADPNGSYDFDHLFVSQQAAPAHAAGEPPPAAALAPVVDVRVGLIDGGVDAERRQRLRSWRGRQR